MPHAVGRQEHSGSDFAQGGSLLIHRHDNPSRNERVGSEQSANPSSDDDGGGSVAHNHFPKITAK
jgi:hypothetical protein